MVPMWMFPSRLRETPLSTNPPNGIHWRQCWWEWLAQGSDGVFGVVHGGKETVDALHHPDISATASWDRPLSPRNL
jgi:malonate-semialdehyde dehydrogenase (acetylating)/methylmalonate-semialdehyde dehydrogenase